MEKKEYKIWEIIIETVTAVGVIVFLGLQIYYRYVYESSFIVFLYHFLPVILLYAGMTVLQMFPEFLNGKNSEPLQGMVRVYAVRMLRNAKLLLILGLLLPSVADALGMGMNAAYSILIMAGILLNIVYYLYRIYYYNSQKKGG